jgi:hypothetical protein
MRLFTLLLYTVNSLLTHTPKNRPSSMRYRGVWVFQVGAKMGSLTSRLSSTATLLQYLLVVTDYS